MLVRGEVSARDLPGQVPPFVEQLGYRYRV